MNKEYFGSIERVFEIEQDFKVEYFVVHMCFNLNYWMTYEKRKTCSRDKVPFKIDIIVGIILQISQLFLDPFSFDFVLKLVMHLDRFD